MLDAGARYARFEDTQLSAIDILSPLCKGQSIVPKVIDEWTHGKHLHETAAGRAVEDNVEQAKKLAEADMKEVREETAEALRVKDFETAKTLEKERTELEGRLQKIEAEREKLRIEYEQNRREQQADWDAQRKREADLYQKKQKKANKRWQAQQREFKIAAKKQKDEQAEAARVYEAKREEGERIIRAEHALEKERKGNRIDRWVRRTAIGVLGTGAVVLTGGLAAPVVVGIAVAHEANCQEEKDCE